MDASTLLRDLPVSVGVVIALVLVLGLADRIMERQSRVTKFTRHLTLILLTVLAADVSLSYEVAHQSAEPLLMDAAERAGLTEPFVQVITLGDYTVTYRVAGFLSDVKSLFTAQSTLRRRVLDTLHDAEVEIASPMLVGHRALSETEALVPKIDKAVLAHREEEESAAPSDLIFDKAEEAELDDRAQEELETLRADVKALKQEVKKASELAKPKLSEEIDTLHQEIKVVEAEFEARDHDAEIDEED